MKDWYDGPDYFQGSPNVMYGETYFTTDYTIEEIKEIRLQSIDLENFDIGYFGGSTIHYLINRVLDRAFKEKKLPNAREGVIYNNMKATQREISKIDKAINELILEKKIYYSYTKEVFKLY